ncbi:uncharacterized protein LOC120173768 [Hibiscus syriacus]|uniref:uncharacterized protein LOC120173768 n=1 Tax=Hibiscus syriacus TaxID=106335 RepID=UPI001923D779|nr:uncharacterized protein LOC120173768 [Hibiscus syriacus]
MVGEDDQLSTEWVSVIVGEVGFDLAFHLHQFSFLLNGSPTDRFRVKRGLRQGCLSPFLFNIVAEGLSSIISKAASLGFFDGISIGQENLTITLLQFADDLIIFCGDGITQVQNTKRLLRCFKLAFGLKLNLKKSTLLGVNVDEAVILSWSRLLNCLMSSLPTSPWDNRGIQRLCGDRS